MIYKIKEGYFHCSFVKTNFFSLPSSLFITTMWTYVKILSRSKKKRDELKKYFFFIPDSLKKRMGGSLIRENFHSALKTTHTCNVIPNGWWRWQKHLKVSRIHKYSCCITWKINSLSLTCDSWGHKILFMTCTLRFFFSFHFYYFLKLEISIRCAKSWKHFNGLH